MRELLGGKGANVAEMTRILGPERVPAGFTITTEACVAYMDADKRFPDGLDDQLADAVVEQAVAGDGWVKLVGDWIDRSIGDLAPCWPHWAVCSCQTGCARFCWSL